MHKLVKSGLVLGTVLLAALPFTASGEPKQIVDLLGSKLPLYEPNSGTPKGAKTKGDLALPVPIKVVNGVGVYEAVIGGSTYWINPADVVTDEAQELKRRCMANVGNQGQSTTGRAFGSGCN